MALARFRFPAVHPVLTPEFPRKAAVVPTAARSYQTELPEKAYRLYRARSAEAILSYGVEPRSFLRPLPEFIRPLLPPDLRAFRPGSGFSLIKLIYGNTDLHYEAWHRPKLQTIEIGLHFEADDLTNSRLLGAFRTHERRIRRELPGARLEEWDKGWTRIWEPVACETLDDALHRDLAALLARYVATLEPILREELPSDVPWKVTRTRSSGPPKRARAARDASARRASAPRARGRAPSARSPRPRRGGSPD